jgi:hypothetical protein
MSAIVAVVRSCRNYQDQSENRGAGPVDDPQRASQLRSHMPASVE